MTRTEERLADALDAAARALREDTLRPLLVPDRPRRRPALAAPLAAAAALLLVVAVGVTVARYLPGSNRSPAAPAAPPRYYVEAGLAGGLPTVRSTATGAVTATVPVPHGGNSFTPYLVTAAANGVFFAAVPGTTGERIYRFRLTAAGRVRALSQVPGGALAGGQRAADAMAASPDGSQVAVSLTPSASTGSASCGPSGPCSSTGSAQSDHIYVVNTATGARSVWQGGIGQRYAFTVFSLSWTADGSELVYYAGWCPEGSGNSYTGCLRGTGTGGASAEVRALSPAARGGTLTSGRLLFRLSPRFPYLPDAVISPDGSTITAVAVTGPAGPSRAPAALALEQISVATGKRLRVLYRQDLGRARQASISAVLVTLSADGTGRYWMLSDLACTAIRCSGGLNGWIDGGRLAPLQPADGTVASEAW